VPEFHVYLVRLIDSGHPLPRAKIVLNLAGLVPDARRFPAYEHTLKRELTLDLFTPPQRELIRAEAARLSAQGHDQRAIAKSLNVTQPAVSRALILHRRMLERGLTEPYETLTGPPDDYHKLQRHRHDRYRFQPLNGYPQPVP
jgi:hypothetical protein